MIRLAHQAARFVELAAAAIVAAFVVLVVGLVAAGAPGRGSCSSSRGGAPRVAHSSSSDPGALLSVRAR